MEEAAYQQHVVLRWADLDPNGHVRHSVYYDFGAAIRVSFFTDHGLGFSVMEQFAVGPILFREEAVFRREIRFGDLLMINLRVTRLRHDGSRFSFRHELFRADGTLCAIITVDGAWIDTRRRKLTAPPEAGRTMLHSAPKSADFEWLDG